MCEQDAVVSINIMDIIYIRSKCCSFVLTTKVEFYGGPDLQPKSFQISAEKIQNSAEKIQNNAEKIQNSAEKIQK